MALVAWVSAVASVLLALLVFWASTQACLFCFTTRVARLRVCHSFVGWKDSLKVNQCLENYQLAFKKLSILEFDYNERNRLHDTFMQMTNSLQQQGLAKGPYDVAFRRAAEKQKMIILQLKRAHACTPPCVQDVSVHQGGQALFPCVVNFPLPKEEITYSWKFSPLRTQSMSYFRLLPEARGLVARIRPVKPIHGGTYSCLIKHVVLPVARLYFFLNVTGPTPRQETELQVTFREVVRWARKEPEAVEPVKPSLGQLLTHHPWDLTWADLCLLAMAMAAMAAALTVLVWMFCWWYFSGY
ncbi:sperm acrosome membrane-associated protein 6 isoform 2-T2 [Thomomys bottae]